MRIKLFVLNMALTAENGLLRLDYSWQTASWWVLPITILSAIRDHVLQRETAARSRARDRKAISPVRWLHSLNSRPHFSRARLSAAPFTTSTRRASSFYAFIYAPFIIFKVRLFLAPAPCGGYLFFCLRCRPPGDRVLLCPSLYFYFRASYYGVNF